MLTLQTPRPHRRGVFFSACCYSSLYDSVSIRPATPADIPAITRIYAHAVRHGTASFELEPPDEAEMARRQQALLRRRLSLHRRRDGGAVLGYAYAGPYRPRPAYRLQRRGFGLRRARGAAARHRPALLDALIAAAPKRGFRQMIAVIGDSRCRPPRSGCIAAAGFRMIGTLDNVGFKHGRWLDSVYMQRALGRWGGTTPAVSAFAAAQPRTTRLESLVEHAQHAVEFVAAPHDQAGRRDHAVGALAARQPRIFLDAVDRDFGAAAEHREHRAVLEEIDGVVAPFSGGDHAAIKAEDAVELAPVEGHLRLSGAKGGTRSAARPRGTRSVRFRRGRSSCGASFLLSARHRFTLHDRAADAGSQAGFRARKRPVGETPGAVDHGFVKEIIILPNFGQAPRLSELR